MTTALDTTRSQLAVKALTTPVSYKAGWTIHFSNTDGLVAHLSAHVPDSRRPRWTTFEADWIVPETISTQTELYDWLLGQLDEIERHETREFYKVEGELWDDPHGPGHRLVFSRSY